MTLAEIIFNKVPVRIKLVLETKANIILHYRTKGISNSYIEESKKLRGYLECLRDLEVITDREMKRLYLYYKNITKPFNR